MLIGKLKNFAGCVVLAAVLTGSSAISANVKSEFRDVILSENAVMLVFSRVPKYGLKKVGNELIMANENCTNLYEYSSINVNNNFVSRLSVQQKKIKGTNGVEVVFTMSRDYAYRVIERDDTLEFLFSETSGQQTNVEPKQVEVKEARVLQEEPQKRSQQAAAAPAASAAAPAARRPETRRVLSLVDRLPADPVSLDFNMADIRDVLRLLSAKSGVNMIYGDDVTGTLTVHLENVPFKEAFETILSLRGLVVQQVGENILRVLKPQTLTEERAKAATFTKVLSLNYAEASQIKSNLDAVRQAEGRKGAIEIDQRTNSLIITDTPEGLASFEKLINELDTKPKQVLIEAKLIEINKDDRLSLGINWQGVSGTQGQDNFVFGGTSDGGDTMLWGMGESVVAGSQKGGTGVSLPGDTQAGFFVGYTRPDIAISAQINALVTNYDAKILASPKITTINNRQASISITEQVPYVQVVTDAGGVATRSTVFADVGIKLDVTPTINADNRITLKLKPEVSKVTATSEEGPAMSKRMAETTVLVPNNETLVIGGLIDETELQTVNKVPLFGDLPLLGYLFKSRNTQKAKKELLIFITPRILTE